MKKKGRTKKFPFGPANKKFDCDEFTPYTNDNKLKHYPSCNKLICDWTNRKNCLIHYKMLKIDIKHGMIVDKVYEIISLQQSKWLEKHISFSTQKRNQDSNDFEKDFYILPKNAFYGKTTENVRKRIKIEYSKGDVIDEIIKHQKSPTNF